MDVLTMVAGRKVRVSQEGVASFNRAWPGSSLSSNRAYWFEFDSSGDLIDVDVPQHDDCRAWLFDGTRPDWSPV